MRSSAHPAIGRQEPGTVRLRPGAHLYMGHDGWWRHRAADGRVTRLRSSGDMDAVRGALVEGAVPGALPQGHVRRHLEAFDRRGLLHHDERSDGSHRARVVLVVDGSGPDEHPVAAHLRTLLAASADIAQAPGLTGFEVDDVDLVVACAGWLPDRRWRAIDAACAATRTPWHRTYVEGTRAVVGPFTAPGGTASYEDTRARLLAATGDVHELLSFWAHLDAGAGVPPVPWADLGGPGGAAMIAGLVAVDVLAALTGGTVPSEGAQLVVDPATATVERHPVLPLPPVWRAADRP